MASTCYYDIQNVCKPFKPTLFKEGDVIYLCIYHLNDMMNIPFIEYLLYKYPSGKMNNTLLFPFIYYTESHSLENQLREFFGKVFELSIQHKGIAIKGVCDFQDNLYLFLDITTYIKHLRKTDYITQQFKRDLWWDVICYEIINSKHIFQYPIDESVTNLFLHYPTLSILTNDKSIELRLKDK